MGGREPTQAINATWVVRSKRRYQFVSAGDGELLVRGETEWVFVDAATGRPRSVPPEVTELFRVTGDDIGIP